MKSLPSELQLAHELCFFFHDQAAHILVEYEKAKANYVTITFENSDEREQFAAAQKVSENGIDLLRKLGRLAEARRTILNAITMGMVSDCLHHVYEALRCLEKRKIVVAFNLLRKPLIDSLSYLAWMLADEDGFYRSFTSGTPEALAQKTLGNRRLEVLENALSKTGIQDLVSAAFIYNAIYNSRDPDGLYGLFQHAVHLVTIERLEIKTSPENFNFIFKDPSDDDLYHHLYRGLPSILMFLAHLVLQLYDRMKPMDAGARVSFEIRSRLGFCLIDSDQLAEVAQTILANSLTKKFNCKNCHAPLKVSRYNATKIVLTDSIRCSACHTTNPLPFSYFF